MSASNKSSANSISAIQANRKHLPSVDALISGILKGDKSALGRAITIIESTTDEDRAKANQILEACLKHKKNSTRIGITGVPGVGKSTFIEAFGSMLTTNGNKVAVLAVDPSSTLSKGSILGDKTRMEKLVKDPNAFIRPSPSNASLGGVTQQTRETIILCEAAGFDTILVETVGVGQSEIAVQAMVDFFLVLKLPGAGDDLQGIKRGIIEMADALVINKADGTTKKAAQIAVTDFKRALHLYPPKEDGWITQVLNCSALHHEGIEVIWKMIQDYIKKSRASGAFELKRKKQRENWLSEIIESELKRDFYANEAIRKEFEKLSIMVSKNEISSFAAAKKLLQIHHKESS